MEFENLEVIERVVVELSRTVDLSGVSSKGHRCFLNYLRLVDKCYSLEGSRVSYSEKIHWHHILPKSLYPEYEETSKGVSNWNQVALTPKEHFVAHHLLYEIYSRSGPMARAFRRMVGNQDCRVYLKKSNLDSLNNWNYKHSDETRARMSESQLGKEKSEIHRSRISESQRGPLNHGFGKKRTEEVKRKISESKKGVPLSEENRRRISESLRGKSQKVIECPHCGSSGGASNMSRYHFDNCKMKVESPSETL